MEEDIVYLNVNRLLADPSKNNDPVPSVCSIPGNAWKSTEIENHASLQDLEKSVIQLAQTKPLNAQDLQTIKRERQRLAKNAKNKDWRRRKKEGLMLTKGLINTLAEGNAALQHKMKELESKINGKNEIKVSESCQCICEVEDCTGHCTFSTQEIHKHHMCEMELQAAGENAIPELWSENNITTKRRRDTDLEELKKTAIHLKEEHERLLKRVSEFEKSITGSNPDTLTSNANSSAVTTHIPNIASSNELYDLIVGHNFPAKHNGEAVHSSSHLCQVRNCANPCIFSDEHQFHLCEEGWSQFVLNLEEGVCPATCAIPTCPNPCAENDHLHELFALSPLAHSCNSHTNDITCGAPCVINDCGETCIIPATDQHNEHMCLNIKFCNQQCEENGCTKSCGETLHTHFIGNAASHFCPIHDSSENS